MLYNQIKARTIRVAGNVAHTRKKMKACRILWERKRSLERQGYRGYNIKIYLREI
jgi:hypothetical protein